MGALGGDLDDSGGMVALNTPIERMVLSGDQWEVHFGGADPQSITVDAVVNSAGLGAQKLARATEGYPAERVPPLFLGKGSYFSFAGRPVFSRLIYPVPIPGGLGVHVTLDMAGPMRFDPHVQRVGKERHHVG